MSQSCRSVMELIRRLHVVVLAGLALFLLATASSSSTTTVSSWAVVSQPTRLVNGSPVLFRVTAPKGITALTGKWLGHDIEFDYDAIRKSWFALAGVSQGTKASAYLLQLNGKISVPASAEMSNRSSTGQPLSFEKKILVGRQRYPRVLLKVPGRYTAPSPDDQREIEKDKVIKAEVFKTATVERVWRGTFAAPVDAPISDVFGVERVFNGSVQSTHQGLDFRVPGGTSVAAVNSGHVILARSLFFEGNCVVIDHGQGLLTLYLHLSKFLIQEGDDIKKGQEIGLSGGTGRATGPHLHLAVRWQGVYLDPQALLKLNLP
jgi:murein DD-endopeptidase MepM/ murein hydrolase activator NlpD